MMTFITPHPSLMLPSKNIVPFYTLDFYRTSNLAPLAPISNTSSAGVVGGINYNYTTINSNSLMLNSIPDAFIIFARPIGLSNNNPDFSFCINSVNIQFNNHAGLCTNMTQA